MPGERTGGPGTLGDVNVATPAGTVSTVVCGDGDRSMLLAHGAGTDQHHRMVAGIRDALAARAVRVITFNYPYTEAGRRRPDRTPVLLDCHRAVTEHVRERFGPRLILGGRSMGGRMATMLAAEGHPPTEGVVAYAYPLHPAGKPDRLRIEHLPQAAVPMLFVQGSRDALARADLVDRHLRTLSGATVVDMPGADHSFRGAGWKEPDVFEFLAARTVEWWDSPDRA